MISSEVIIGTDIQVVEAIQNTTNFVKQDPKRFRQSIMRQSDQEDDMAWFNISTDSGNFLPAPDPVRQYALDIESKMSDEPLCSGCGYCK